MSDPRRLLDDPALSPALREVLAAGRESPLGAEALSRVQARVTVRAMSSAAAAPTTGLGVALGAALLVGVALAAMFAGREPVDAEAERVEAPPLVAPEASPERAASPQPVLAPPPAVPDPTPVRARSAKRTGAASGAPTRDQAEEAKLLLAARRALAVDPARALGLADRHRRDYPAGALVEERELLAIRALAALGRDEAARRRADAFLARFPASSHRPAVEKAVVGDD